MTSRKTLTMGGAALVVSASVLVSRLLGLLRETLLAALLGVTAAGDVYRNAFLLPDLLNYLLAGGFLSITLIPLLARHLESGAVDRAWAAFRAVFTFLAVTVVALTALLYLAAPALIDLLYPRLPSDQVATVVTLTRIALPAQIFFVLGALFMAVSYTQKRFLFPALAPVIYNLGIISGGLIAAARGETGPGGFVWGAVAGAVVGNFALQWLGARRAGWRWTGAPSPGAVREYLLLAFPLMVGQSVAVLDEQFPRLFGQIAGTGGTAALSLARMLNMLPVGLIAQAAGVASFPFLARLVARGQEDEADQTSFNAAASAGILGLGACALVVATAEPAVRVVYQWGRFGTGEVATVSGLLAIFSLSIPAWAIHQVIARWFYAHRRMWVPVVVGTAVTALALPVTLLAASTYGSTGIAAASSLVIWAYTVALTVSWARGSNRRSLRRLARRLLPALLVAIPAAIVGRLVARSLGGSDPVSALPALVGGGLTVLVVLMGGGRLAKVPSFSWQRREDPPRPVRSGGDDVDQGE
jgi:putative peptidoglycan lipid II flippase